MNNILRLLIASVLCTTMAWPVAASELVPMKTAWQGEHETFIVWYAKEQGWDKEVGLDVSMLHFDSGKSIIDGIHAYKWAVAGCGAVPALVGSFSNKLSLIAVANDESYSNAIYVRPDSPLLAIKDAASGSPEVRQAAADTVRGRTILCQRNTSGHYLLMSWLKKLGLNANDVHIKYIEPTPALGSLVSGVGDAVVLWAPYTYEAEARGLMPLVLSSDCEASQPVLLVANTAYSEQHPEHIEAFLTMYLRGVEMLRSTTPEELADEYIRFHAQWSSRTLTREVAIRDLREHPVFTLTEQLAMFDTTQGTSQLQQWLGKIVAFYLEQGTVREEEKARLQRLNNVTDVYLKKLR